MTQVNIPIQITPEKKSGEFSNLKDEMVSKKRQLPENLAAHLQTHIKQQKPDFTNEVLPFLEEAVYSTLISSNTAQSLAKILLKKTEPYPESSVIIETYLIGTKVAKTITRNKKDTSQIAILTLKGEQAYTGYEVNENKIELADNSLSIFITFPSFKKILTTIYR